MEVSVLNKVFDWLFARSIVDELHESIGCYQRQISDLLKANRRLREDVESLKRRDVVQRAVIQTLRDCNRELDERNVSLEVR